MGRRSRSPSPGEFPLLRALGLKATQIIGDGNCLFNAFSDQVYGDQSRSQEIRATVIKHMRENAEDFKPFVPVEAGGGHRRNPKRKNVASSTSFSGTPVTQEQIDLSWKTYLQRMSENGTYGDNLEIRAFSQAYNVDVRIYNRENNLFSRVATDGVPRRSAHVALHTWEHYSSVRNINGPFTGPPNIQIDFLHEVPEVSSIPGTPAFSQSGSSSMERDPDSDDEAIGGPNKRQKEKDKQETNAAQLLQEQDIPTISLTAPAHPRPRIILHTKSQQKQHGPTKKFVSARDKDTIKKQNQKRDRKERKKQAVNTPQQHLAPSTVNVNLKANPTSMDLVGMKTLTI